MRIIVTNLFDELCEQIFYVLDSRLSDDACSSPHKLFAQRALMLCTIDRLDVFSVQFQVT